MSTSPSLHQVSSKGKSKRLREFHGRDDYIFLSGLAVRPENPHFVWRLRGRKIYDVFIPRDLIACNRLKIPDIISLVDERGKEWDMRIYRSNSDCRMACSRIDWRSMCEANFISIGDACICEFMQGPIGLYIRLRIIRAHELCTAGIFESGRAIQPENPYFVWRSTYPRSMKRQLYIPQKFTNWYNLKILNSLSLVDERGNQWETRLIKKCDGTVVCSNTEWTKLCYANHIGIGDRCICEFRQGSNGLAIHVRVIRAQADRLRSSDDDIFESGRTVQPENPYFVWKPTRPESMTIPLYIPKKLSDRYNLKILNSLSLVDERGKEWETKLTKRCDGTVVCSSTGWGKLCDANHIGMGDRCICEFRPGSNGLAMHVRVIRAQADRLTRKKGVEEETVEQVDVESTYESDCDENAQDESGMQRNIVEGKSKLNTTPVRRSLRKRNTSDQRKVIEEEKIEKIEQIDEEKLDLEGITEDVEHGAIENRDSYIKKVSKTVISKDVNQKRRKLSRHKNDSSQGKSIGSSKCLDLDPPEVSGWKTEDNERIAIENRDAYIIKLKGIIKTLISKNVNQKRGKIMCQKDDDTSQGKSIGSSKCLPKKLELLQSYFQRVGKQAAESITLPNDVFGKNYKICILLEDVKKFCKLKPIADCCIISYVWYLHRKMKTENLLHRFLFVNPNCISYASTRKDRARALADRLIGASTDQLVLAPCNVGLHWILTVIKPYNKTVFLLDPLSHRIRDEDWRDVVNDALSMFGASKGDEQLKLARWEVVKAHLQPDAKQCGFYIMRYMKQIIEACRDLGSISLHSMFTKEEYSKSEIDEIRTEWAEFVLDHIGTTKDKS